MRPPPLPIADCTHKKSETRRADPLLTVHTYWDKEQDAGDHRRERRAADDARVDVPAEADDERARGRDDVAAVGDELVRGAVRSVREAGEDDHDRELNAPRALQVLQRGASRVDRHKEEHRPPRQWLAPPWPVGVAVAPWQA